MSIAKPAIIILIASLALLLMTPATMGTAQETPADPEVTETTSIQEQINEVVQEILRLQARLRELIALRNTVSRETIAYTETFANTLTLNDQGEEVKKLQNFLAQDPDIYPEGLITGHFGLMTLEAVKRFQIKHNIIPSGVVGITTVKKLNELINEEKSVAVENTPKPITIEPPDNEPPRIFAVETKSITRERAKILFGTTEPARGAVYFSTTTPIDTTDPKKILRLDGFGFQHVIRLTDLNPETRYYYIVEATDESGNQATSSLFGFDTDPIR